MAILHDTVHSHSGNHSADPLNARTFPGPQAIFPDQFGNSATFKFKEKQLLSTAEKRANNCTRE
jgi:hypothetical protein